MCHKKLAEERRVRWLCGATQPCGAFEQVTCWALLAVINWHSSPSLGLPLWRCRSTWRPVLWRQGQLWQAEHGPEMKAVLECGTQRTSGKTFASRPSSALLPGHSTLKDLSFKGIQYYLHITGNLKSVSLSTQTAIGQNATLSS